MGIRARFTAFEGVTHAWLVRHSITALRVTMGLVFLGFGILKYFPGVSPAQDLTVTTTRILTFDLLPGALCLALVATLECLIGLILIVGRGLRLVVYLLALELLGILSPAVLLPERLFSGPFHAPTLEGQYVLKDIVLVAAAMVVATTFRRARIAFSDHDYITTSGNHIPIQTPHQPRSPQEKLDIVMSGLRGDHPVPALCRRHGITTAQYTAWRHDAITGATHALDTADPAEDRSPDRTRSRE
ncbi:DoxX family membrane protein [Amycolatopsis minnesotensis]|uniref:DoxX family membrane protein n=1 Tax=Amycolatopsis minnesotensis TaxID=337894 RepID=A0ABP5EA04_9PSEU